MLHRTNAAHLRLIGVLSDVLTSVSAVPLELPMPVDRRALIVAKRLIEAVGRDDDVDIFVDAGASRRTIERLFVAEVGVTIGKWRQQARLLHALRLLAAGEPVTSVALEVGYSSTSAFISMFRRSLGATPSRYYGRS